MIGKKLPMDAELGEKLPERPAWWRRRPSYLALAGALAIGAVTADTVSHDSSTARALRAPTTTPALARESLSNKPQLSVNDETRMRHNAETAAEIIFFLKSIKPRINYDPAFWYQLHHCEQADTWHAGGYFGNGLRSGENGLGMSLGAWRTAVFDAAKRGVKLPLDARNANIDEQMEGAQAYLEDEGWHWQCPRP